MGLWRPLPQLSDEEAHAIARSTCGANMWPWQEPVMVLRGPFTCTVITNAGRVGMNARIKIRKRDKTVVSSSFIRR